MVMNPIPLIFHFKSITHTLCIINQLLTPVMHYTSQWHSQEFKREGLF